VSVADTFFLKEQSNISSASIILRRGVGAEAIGSSIGMAMPAPNRWTAKAAAVMLATAPETWLIHQRDAPISWFHDLEHKLQGCASLSELTGAFRFFQLDGPKARTLLQRGMAIDFHDSMFPAGSLAMSVIAHIDVSVRCLKTGESYEIAVNRSYAESFLRWFHAASRGISS